MSNNSTQKKKKQAVLAYGPVQDCFQAWVGRTGICPGLKGRNEEAPWQSCWWLRAAQGSEKSKSPEDTECMFRLDISTRLIPI